MGAVLVSARPRRGGFVTTLTSALVMRVRQRAPLSILLLTAWLAACDQGGSGTPSADAQTPDGTVAASDSARGVADSISAAADIPVAFAPSDTSRAARLSRRVPKPDSVRALYVNAWASGSRSRMENLIRIADQTEINAFIIDIKESDTYLSYDGTRIPLALEIGADKRPATKWLPALIDTLVAHNIFPIARIVVFKDRMLAEKKPELAIRHANGSVWKDNKGGPWVNPYDKRVWDYNIAIAREALDMGFSELQWDYVRFPDVTNSARAVMRYPGSDSVSRADNIANFIAYSKTELAEFNVPVTADVFGLVTHLEGDVEIGQNWEKVITVSDAVLPMVYPSHYAAGLYGLAKPIASPYETVRYSMEDAVERTRWVRDSLKQPVGEVMPWLEAMSIRGATYGPAALREQIEATYDAGLKSYALWNPGSKYAEFEEAFRPAAGGPSPLERGGWKKPEFTPSRSRLSTLIRKRDAAARAAIDSTRKRDSVAAAGGGAPPP